MIIIKKDEGATRALKNVFTTFSTCGCPDQAKRLGNMILNKIF